MTLRNLVKLDLSSNKLRSLPENFGKLENLQHLDLYKNQLEVCQVFLCYLGGGACHRLQRSIRVSHVHSSHFFSDIASQFRAFETVEMVGCERQSTGR